MSKTDRRAKRTPAERPLPEPACLERLRYEAMPVQSIRVVMVPRISIASHYRTTALDGTRDQIPVYVTTKRAEQVTHPHYFADLDRFGCGACQTCGATGWSAFWVAEGVFSENTGAWIADEQRRMDDLVAQSLVADVLGGEIIALEREPEEITLVVADLDMDEPARQLDRNRPGIPVPPMKRGHLSVVD